jgi:hypothetical protein
MKKTRYNTLFTIILLHNSEMNREQGDQRKRGRGEEKGKEEKGEGENREGKEEGEKETLIVVLFLLKTVW